QPAVGRNAVPMTIDHLGEFLIRREPLPLETCAPVLEEAPRPAFAFIAPQLAEALLENIGRVEPFVGRQQYLQRLLAVEREILSPREQRVFLALDVAPLAILDPGILALANRIQGLPQMADEPAPADPASAVRAREGHRIDVFRVGLEIIEPHRRATELRNAV